MMASRYGSALPKACRRPQGDMAAAQCKLLEIPSALYPAVACHFLMMPCQVYSSSRCRVLGVNPRTRSIVLCLFGCF